MQRKDVNVESVWNLVTSDLNFTPIYSELYIIKILRSMMHFGVREFLVKKAIIKVRQSPYS